MKTTAVTKPQNLTSSSQSTKGGSKTPVFGSGDREPFSRGSRGKTFAAPQGKTNTAPRASSQTGESSTAKPTALSTNVKQDVKPKSAIEKQAEIAQKCAAAFKGVSSPAPDVEMLSKSDPQPVKSGTTPSQSTAKPAAPSAATTPSAAKKKETEAPTKTASGKEMTEEERAREEEIQRKIKESVVVIENDKNPTAEEVEKILKTPPAFEVCMILLKI